MPEFNFTGPISATIRTAGGGYPWRLWALILGGAAVAGWAALARPRWPLVTWREVATVAAVAYWGGVWLVVRRWRARREVAALRASEPVVRRWRSGEQIREPRMRP